MGTPHSVRGPIEALREGSKIWYIQHFCPWAVEINFASLLRKHVWGSEEGKLRENRSMTNNSHNKSGQVQGKCSKLLNVNAKVREPRIETMFVNGSFLLPQVKASLRHCLQELQVFCSWAGRDGECHHGLNFTCGWDGKSYMSPQSTCKVIQSEGLFYLGLPVTSVI